ncbi:hypothetical protein [Endozoicomonas numazuensis]|uniref:Uncharacterized protein n=1 Tax=Endozoicomonas numazuensis TaxID=1137799 RepID=A0A081NM69_9GAMM|nr:hypothetical protein [Endozoicomonas numazuensis]KEQ19542.1 hypothetical protein GZ78_06405 [Endozoicomonas numazuensis]
MKALSWSRMAYDLESKRQKGIINNLHFGLSSYLKPPRLRALWGAYFAVASGSAMLIVNTAVYTHWISRCYQATSERSPVSLQVVGDQGERTLATT